MRSRTPLILLASLLGAGAVEAQLVDERLVPGGTVRVHAFPTFDSWDERFGIAPDGSEARESLGDDLTAASALSIFPGVPALLEAVRATSGDQIWNPVLGGSEAQVTQDRTVIDLGIAIGVTDWLTVGAMIPRVKTRTAVELAFSPDTLLGDVGLNPTLTDAAGVSGFTAGLGTAAITARARADQLCAAADPGCAGASDLAVRAEGFDAGLVAAYGASPFFPLAGSTIGTALSQQIATLDADLVAAGLAPIGAALPLAAAHLAPGDLATLPATSGGLGLSPIESREALWSWGDLEVSALARMLEGGGSQPGVGYEVLVGALVRLGTGTVSDPDIPFDQGSGDGQLDIEGRVMGRVALNRSLALRGGIRYGVQGERTVTRRVAPPEVVLAPLSTRRELRWTPGSYFGLEVAPALRVTPELSIAGEYRLLSKGMDTFELVGAPSALVPDGSVLEAESEVGLHQAGVTLLYDTLSRARSGTGSTAMQVHGRWMVSVAGRGGQTPVATTVEFGIRLFRTIWGGGPG